MLRYVFGIFVIKVVSTQVLYDSYYGKPVTEERNLTLSSLPQNPTILGLLNIVSPCTISVRPCNKFEDRRVDGTCANPRYPSMGGSPTPLLRMLPAQFGLGNTIKPAINGSELPSARLIRTKILSEGYHADPHFSMLLSHALVFSYLDNIDVDYLLRYFPASDCCLGNTPNRVNPSCISIPVPEDDPFLRRTGVRCMNLTRFFTYQEVGCIPNSLPAERLSLPTPLLDLSVIYGYTEQRSREIRTFQGGELRAQNRRGVETPPGTALTCLRNQPPLENTCYQFGDVIGGNTLMGVILYSLWWYREHNRIARRLAEINPCWDDEELFQTARKIAIAEWQHILYYEAMAAVLGRKNAEEVGILHHTKDYANDFDERYKPGVFHEYVLAGRWFHTLQEGRFDIYNRAGKYLGTRTTVDDAMRSGVLEYNNTEADLSQGAFRQNTARIDYNIDPDLAERLFGEGFQYASDLSSIDITRGRDHGLPSYNAYRKLCGMPVARKWKDFREIHPDKLEQLRRLYSDVDEVELMPALYAEKLMKDSYVPPTLFCIFTQNLVQWRKADRHFFEQGGAAAAASLTLTQLNEIRKSSAARHLCDNGDRVTEIQPHAFYAAGPGNKITPCKKLPEVDLHMWADEKCRPDMEKPIAAVYDDWGFPEPDTNSFIYKK